VTHYVFQAHQPDDGERFGEVNCTLSPTLSLQIYAQAVRVGRRVCRLQGARHGRAER
jgi:hypothetical protein